MQQPSVAEFFKVKKRVRDDSNNVKSSKLLAISSTSKVPGGRDIPNPISREIEPPCLEPNVTTYTELIVNNDRITAKGKRRVPCFKRYHHLVSKANQEDVVMAPTLNKESSAPISSPTIKAANETPLRDPYSTNMPLPYKYNILLEIFRALETVTSIFFNRNEVVTFSKVKPAVLELVRTTQLREKHLAQILTVFPNSYTFTQEKIKAPGSREPTYQLVLTPNLQAIPSAAENNKMSATLITERRKVFETYLTNLCYKHHEKFLNTLNPPIIIPSNKEITRWHPRFPLNEVSDIELSAIPKPPEVGTISASTAKEFIARAQNIMESANPRMKKALEELMKKSADVKLTTPTEISTTTFFSTTTSVSAPSVASTADQRAATKNVILKAQQALMNKAKDNPKMREALNKVLEKYNKVPIPAPIADENTKAPIQTQQPSTPLPKVQEKGNVFNKKSLAALKGVSQSLLDKIRAREQEKSIRTMTLTPEETKRRIMLARLPEFVKIVRNTMVAEKKSVLALDVIVERLAHSHYRSLSYSEVEGHVRLLHTTVPEWLTILNSFQGEFVKIDKEMDINGILEEIEQLLKKNK